MFARRIINTTDQSDVNHATLHRAEDFRSLALKLTLEPEM